MTEPAALTPLEFDSTHLGLPCYRVRTFDSGALARDCAALKARHERFLIDAKIPADDLDGTAGLLALGFRKICVQATFWRPSGSGPAPGAACAISDRLELDPAAIDVHARNLRFARHYQDPLLEKGRARALYAAWIANSLSSGKRVAHHHTDFCTFSEKGGEALIDLVSVTGKGEGTGSRLLQSVRAYARDRGLKGVRVTTECENIPAMRFYEANGFVLDTLTSVLHLVRTPEADQTCGPPPGRLEPGNRP